MPTTSPSQQAQATLTSLTRLHIACTRELGFTAAALEDALTWLNEEPTPHTDRIVTDEITTAIETLETLYDLLDATLPTLRPQAPPQA
jgi:hypothetical protein